MSKVVECPMCGAHVVQGKRWAHEHFKCSMCALISYPDRPVGKCAVCGDTTPHGGDCEHRALHPITGELVCLPYLPKGATDLHVGKITLGERKDTMWDFIVN